ncbi:hypothetical protein LJC74_07345, partial [Eubacteriales bacterium OttesenSCG-928-A19]|nr:hypothetical protein [Eubacteriales bacterium OttesenSCG-928-A19]
MALYSAFARVLRTGFQILHPRWRADREGYPQGAAIFIVHHQNMFGPVHFMGLAHVQAHMWSLHCFLDREKCFDQYYGYTFQTRYGWPEPVSRLAARVLSYVVPLTLRSLDAFPVYHDATNIITMRKSLDAFKRDEPIVICPDIDYASTSPAIGEIYKGFLHLGTLYRRSAQKDIPFIPVYCSRKRRRILYGPPIYLDSGLRAADAHDRAADEIRQGINALGMACGDIPREE